MDPYRDNNFGGPQFSYDSYDDAGNPNGSRFAASDPIKNARNLLVDLRFTFSETVYKCRHSRKLVLLVVFIALFFDNMLLTTIGIILYF
jgi:hypothetical protein